ncbi:MAG: class I SAM-dependent methyltransferase [Nitrospirota bacterium]|nr:class I SAM-dependent methyltransferase [Nitrospirota bacterium]
MLELKEKPASARPVPPPPEGTVPDWSGKGKEQAVQRMFTAIARWYDLNNSLLSFGLHHRWKRLAVKYLFEPSAGACGFRSGEVSAEPRYALDIGAGTGDLALLIQPRMGEAGRVAAVDLNQAMLQEGLRKIAGRGLHGRITCLRANAEQLGFRDNSFDAVTTGFCIRNVSDLLGACMEICRVLKPGGRFVCLEFSRPAHAWLLRLYDWYSFSLLPKIGTLVAHDRTGVYRYLPASIRAFPDQEGLKALLLKAGFRHVDYYNVSGGIVAIHVATK